ncbi:MAG: DbpA RNA binding domain-containing protein, partial [Rhodocyclaceae bacterium]|nr:DbpA RNA binding domain-containing protein [Rhodocyclaceae bacterium]
GLPTKGEVAERRIGQFKQQIVDVIAEENLDFFFEVVRRMESEDNLAARQIAAALAFLAQRERPLQPPGFDVPAAPVAPTAPAAPVRTERQTAEETRRAAPSVSSPPGGRTPQSGVFGGGSFERPAREARADSEERPERPERKERPASRNFSGSPVVRYRIEVGKNQGALPKEIVGAIANEGGIDGKLIGQINLFDDYSTVELPELPAEVFEILQRTRVRQLPLKIRVAAVGEGESRSRPPAKPRWEKDREPAREPRERRPASADFSARPRRDVKESASADPSSKPPYRSEKKPAERGAPPTGKPFNKFSGKPKKY